MQTARFYGASDDLVEVEGVKGGDEFPCYQSDENRLVYASFVLGGKLRIRALYDGCWSFAVGQVDEDIAMPDWPIRITQNRDPSYSALLEIDCPDDVKVFLEPAP